MTQRQVAKRLGLKSPQFLSNIERGVQLPPLRILGILSKTYRVNPESLLRMYAKTILPKFREEMDFSSKTRRSKRRLKVKQTKRRG